MEATQPGLLSGAVPVKQAVTASFSSFTQAGTARVLVGDHSLDSSSQLGKIVGIMSQEDSM